MRSLRELTDPLDGRVAVYDVAQKKWKRAWPVDARELLKSGAMTLEGPKDEPKAAVRPTGTPQRAPAPEGRILAGPAEEPKPVEAATPLSGKSAPVQMPTERKPG